MIRFLNPLGVLKEVFEQEYPDYNCEVHFVENQKNSLGETFFPDDGGDPIIQIGAEKTIPQMLDIMAHELAHVVAGITAEHGKEWENIYNNIYKVYQYRMGIREKKT